MGNGAQWIVESVPDKRVKLALQFEGYDDLSYAYFDLKEIAGGTEITWGFDSQFSGIAKYFGLFMEGMLGPSYEEGLTNLSKCLRKKANRSLSGISRSSY